MGEKVLIVGPRKSMKGGITTVINGYKKSNYFNSQFNVHHYSSCIDGNKFVKLFYMSLKLLFFPFFILFFNPKIVHIHMAFGSSFVRKKMYLRISKFFGKIVLLHVHGAEWDAFYTNSSIKKKKTINKVFESADKIIVLSDEWKEKINGVTKKDNIVVINNFVSIDKIDIKRINTDLFNIVFLGEFCERKGCFNIIEILSHIKNKSKINMIFAGYGDNNKLDYLIKTQKLGIKISNIGFVDYRKKVDLLSKTYIFLFPSFNEGVPMVLLEAMSFGIPCVTTNVGGIPSIISEKIGNGKNFDPTDFIGMANEIDKLLNDSDYYNEISVNSKKIASEFDVEKTIFKTIELYNSFLRERDFHVKN